MDTRMNFELSYPLDVTEWDGKVIRLRPEAYVRAKIADLRKAGLEWCMPAGFQIEEPLEFDIDAGAKACGELIAGGGLRISSHHCLVVTFAPLDASQEQVRAKMRRTVEFCSLLKAGTLVIHPGRIEGKHVAVDTIYSGFESELAKHGLERVLEVVAGNFRHMGEYAADFGVKLALENMGRFEPLGDIATLPRLVEMVALPNVGYCLDSGHAHAIGESVLEWIDIMGDKLFTTHFHDNSARLAGMKFDTMFVPADKTCDEHLSPGFGTIAWMDVIAKLRAINYRWPVNFETGGWPLPDALEGYQRAIQWWRACETLAANREAKR